MDDTAWMTAEEPGRMLALAGDRLSHAQLRRFALDCVRDIAPYLTDERTRRAFAAAEAFADGRVGADELERARVPADEFFSDSCIYGTSTGDHAARAAALVAAPDPVNVGLICYCCTVAWCFQATNGYKAGEVAMQAARSEILLRQCDRLRGLLIARRPG